MSHKLQSEVPVPIDERAIRFAYVGCGFMAQNVHREEAAHFLSCLKNGAPFDSSGEDALLDVWTFEEIYKKHIGIAP